MNQEKEQALLSLLQTEWNSLTAALTTLQLSVDKCKSIGKKAAYSFEELESFDSLTSKFNRASDIFTQKILRTVWMLLHEPFVPFIDMMSKSEKISLLQSSDQMIEIRDLRNQISREYLPEAIHDLVPEVILFTSQLAQNIETCFGFLRSRHWINSN
jgi:hypothetical protein